ncbi:MAG: hypothetical protein ABSD59_23965 [Terracidiphilus sp.]
MNDPEALSRLHSAVATFFLESGDFNGVAFSALQHQLCVSVDEMSQMLQAALTNGTVEISFASKTGNPHIKRLAAETVGIQRELLATEDKSGICVYPSPTTMQAVIGQTYDDRPYTKRLALVEAQLVPLFFDLVVLERYFRDPRFECWFGDSSGNITIGDKAYLSEETPERDKVSFKFGIGYDPKRTRVVAVFLYELASLSPEHQQAFRALEVREPCVMNSDYERAAIWGLWGEYESVYHAFIQEQIEINKLCERIGKPSLFKQTFEDHDRPMGFNPMLRPTEKEYQEFMHLLDKMLSDNINREFFRNDIPLEEDVKRKDGRIEVRPLNTITLLERWFNKRYRTSDGEDVSKQIVASLRSVRKARQPAAHAVQENVYDPSLPGLQDEILGETKQGLTMIRWALTSHPRANGYTAPEWLDGEKIVFF